MKEKRDIRTSADIRRLVDVFYEKVRRDGLLSPIFNERIQDCWPQHLEKMYSFWRTVLLNERTYFGSPFSPHAQLIVDHSHFQRWMQLFIEATDTLFEGKKAEEAKWRAEKMAELFESKIEHYKKQGFKNLL